MSELNDYQARGCPQPDKQDIQWVARSFLVTDAVCINDVTVSHLGVRCFNSNGVAVLKARYSLQIRYTDSCNQGHTAYEEGEVFFFDPPENARVYFLNPVQAENGCGGKVQVCFQALLRVVSQDPATAR